MDQKKAGAWILPLIKIVVAVRLKRKLGESPFQLIDPFEKYTPPILPLSIEAP